MLGIAVFLQAVVLQTAQGQLVHGLSGLGSTEGQRIALTHLNVGGGNMERVGNALFFCGKVTANGQNVTCLQGKGDSSAGSIEDPLLNIQIERAGSLLDHPVIGGHTHAGCYVTPGKLNGSQAGRPESRPCRCLSGIRGEVDHIAAHSICMGLQDAKLDHGRFRVCLRLLRGSLFRKYRCGSNDGEDHRQGQYERK